MEAHSGSAHHGRARAFRPAAALLFLCGSALALSSFAAGETGAPVLGADGIWRTSGDWTVNGGDVLEYSNATIAVAGNLTVQAGAQLALINVTLDFAGAGAQEASVRATNANLTFQRARIVNASQVALSASQADVFLGNCSFARAGGSPADVRLNGGGTYTIDSTDFGTLLSTGGPTVSFFATLHIRLVDPAGAGVSGRINGSTGASFFFEFTDAQGQVAPKRVVWMVLGPAPAQQTAQQRIGGPLRITGFKEGLGGNSSDIPINAASMDIVLPLDHPFDLGLPTPLIAGHDPQAVAPGPYYVDPNETARIVVRIRNGEGKASPATTLNVTWFKADPSSWAPLEAKAMAPIDVPPLAPGETFETSLYQVMGDWGTRVDHNGQCYQSVRIFSFFQFALPGPAIGDFGPWNDTARAYVVAYNVTGDPAEDCTSGAGPGSIFIIASGAGALAGVATVTYLFSGERPARRAAKRAESRQEPPPK